MQLGLVRGRQPIEEALGRGHGLPQGADDTEPRLGRFDEPLAAVLGRGGPADEAAALELVDDAGGVAGVRAQMGGVRSWRTATSYMWAPMPRATCR